jgi:hypothetical protein
MPNSANSLYKCALKAYACDQPHLLKNIGKVYNIGIPSEVLESEERSRSASNGMLRREPHLETHHGILPPDPFNRIRSMKSRVFVNFLGYAREKIQKHANHASKAWQKVEAGVWSTSIPSVRMQNPPFSCR